MTFGDTLNGRCTSAHETVQSLSKLPPRSWLTTQPPALFPRPGSRLCVRLSRRCSTDEVGSVRKQSWLRKCKFWNSLVRSRPSAALSRGLDVELIPRRPFPSGRCDDNGECPQSLIGAFQAQPIGSPYMDIWPVVLQSIVAVTAVGRVECRPNDILPGRLPGSKGSESTWRNAALDGNRGSPRRRPGDLPNDHRSFAVLVESATERPCGGGGSLDSRRRSPLREKNVQRSVKSSHL